MQGVVKNALKFKREQNGLFLKIHNTVRMQDGSKRSVRFISLDVMKSNEAFAAFDEENNIFVFHFTDKCFWQLPDAKVHGCSAIKFIPQQNNNNLLIGNKSGFIYEIEINTGTTLRCIKAFSTPINQLSFPFADPKVFVASSSNQIKIYDLDSFQRKYEFTPTDDARINFVKFLRHEEKLLVVLTNNIVCILSSSLKLIRHFDPLKARRKYLQKSNQKMEKLNYIYDLPDGQGNTACGDIGDADVDKLIKSVTRNYQNGAVTDISFTQNGACFCVSFLDNFIMICNTSMWDVRRIVKFPNEIYIKQCAFIPSSSHEFNSNMLLTSTSSDELMLMSLKDLNCEMLIDMNNTAAFTLSCNGKVLLNMHLSGEILVYNLEHCLSVSSAPPAITSSRNNCGKAITTNDAKWTNQGCPEWSAELDKIQTKLNKIMPISRLLPILGEFGEYPETYRAMIWKTVLRLPLNYSSFASLLKREPHSCVANYTKRYSHFDQKTLGNLSKIISCLAHWTPIFGYITFLPKIVLPFLKMFKSDLLLCFEVITTILTNQCQLWFEFAPSQIPYNYLSLIENILMENDRKLYDFYKSKNVTAKIYALPLMETVFSEVLDEQQWLQLWDHIVSNEPHFMVFIIVAYNSALRLMVMRCESVDDISRIFLEQNYVNLKKVVARAHRMMARCPSGIHPKQFMKPFIPLMQGEYQKFENYPKKLTDRKANEIDQLREEQKVLDAKLADMARLEKTINLRLESHLIDEEYEKRMRDVESTYEKVLGEEEDRITYQRKMLLLSIKKLRERENEMLIQGKNSLLRKKVEMSENELKKMIQNLEKQRAREEIELQMTEENLKLKEMSSLAASFDSEANKQHETLETRYKTSIEEIQQQKRRFMDQLQYLENSSSNTSSTSKISDVELEEKPLAGFHDDAEVLESVFERIQNDYACSTNRRWKNKEDYKQRMKTLEEASEKLENEIYQLLRGLKG